MAGERRSERTKVMMENFMTEHENGFSIYKIAEKYGLHYTTVYDHLEEIAEANGLSRDDLLQQVRTRVPDAVWQRRNAETKKSLATLQEEISKTMAATENLLNALTTLINEDKEN